MTKKKAARDSRYQPPAGWRVLSPWESTEAVGTSEIAEHAGVDASTVRQHALSFGQAH